MSEVNSEVIRQQIFEKLKQIQQFVEQRKISSSEQLMKELWENDYNEEEVDNHSSSIEEALEKIKNNTFDAAKKKLKEDILQYLLDDSNTNRFVMK